MRISFFRQTIRRVRPGLKTERGSDVPDWNNADTLEIAGCSVQPGATSLSQDGRTLAVTDGLTVYLPVSDVQAGDRIAVDGKTYTLLGEPRTWISPSGKVTHMELSLQRWYG